MGITDNLILGNSRYPSVLRNYCSRGDPKFPQSGHQVLPRPVALYPVAVGAQQLHVLDVVVTTCSLRDDVVYLKRLESPVKIVGEWSQRPQPHLEDGSIYRALRPT